MMQFPKRLNLARLPTPIHFLKHTSKKVGKEIYVWRDDLNGMIDSGNKLRKLEFLMADAIDKGSDWIVTCGGPQSNHTRATSAVSRSLGLGTSVLILPRPGFDHTKPANANLLLNQLFDSKLIWIDPKKFIEAGSVYDSFFATEVEVLQKAGKKPCVIPLGGSNPLGCYGYITAVEEMLKTWKSQSKPMGAPTSVFCALGSGGTFMGLSLGLKHYSPTSKVYGVNVIGALETANRYVKRLVDSFKAEGTQVQIDPECILDGYVGGGYAVASDADLLFYREIARTDGIILDPCYTGKAFQGMIAELEKHPEKFGDQILFLHSGGAFGNFAYADQYRSAFETVRGAT